MKLCPGCFADADIGEGHQMGCSYNKEEDDMADPTHAGLPPIKGYRALNETEIALINQIKADALHREADRVLTR